MKLAITKENQQFVFEDKQENDYSFGIEASGIKTIGDIQEIIHQCKLVESQLTDELNSFVVSSEGSFCLQKGNCCINQQPQ
jgi:hypothetical protein